MRPANAIDTRRPGGRFHRARSKACRETSSRISERTSVSSGAARKSICAYIRAVERRPSEKISSRDTRSLITIRESPEISLSAAAAVVVVENNAMMLPMMEGPVVPPWRESSSQFPASDKGSPLLSGGTAKQLVLANVGGWIMVEIILAREKGPKDFLKGRINGSVRSRYAERETQRARGFVDV